MFQQYINEARAAQQRQDRLREAAIARRPRADKRAAPRRARRAFYLPARLRAGLAFALRRLAARAQR